MVDTFVLEIHHSRYRTCSAAGRVDTTLVGSTRGTKKCINLTLTSNWGKQLKLTRQETYLPIQLTLLLQTHRKMDNGFIFDQFLQDVLQVNTDCVMLQITVFIDFFGALITTTDEDIDTFVYDTYSSNSARAAAARIVITPIVSTFLQVVRFELNDREMYNALTDKDTINAISMAQINILR